MEDGYEYRGGDSERRVVLGQKFSFLLEVRTEMNQETYCDGHPSSPASIIPS